MLECCGKSSELNVQTFPFFELYGSVKSCPPDILYLTSSYILVQDLNAQGSPDSYDPKDGPHHAFMSLGA